MSTTSETWAELTARTDAPAGWYSRRTGAGQGHNLLLAVRKPDNTPGLLMEARTASVPSDLAVPESIGFEFSAEPIVPGPGGSTRLVLLLRRPEFRDVFVVLVDDVVAALTSVAAEKAAIRVLAARLRIWHTFFRAHGPDGLSNEAQRGLLGELLALRDHVLPAAGATSALHAWTGPLGGVHDFSFAAGAIEVKTTARLPPPPFIVNGLGQLDERTVGKLLLAHVQLELRPDGTSLPEVVAALRGVLQAMEPAALAEFDDRLLEAGYVQAHAARYIEHCYALNTIRFFGVTGGFPRITPADVGAGVDDVTYSVTLAACKDYEVGVSDIADAVRRIIDGG